MTPDQMTNAVEKGVVTGGLILLAIGFALVAIFYFLVALVAAVRWDKHQSVTVKINSTFSGSEKK